MVQRDQRVYVRMSAAEKRQAEKLAGKAGYGRRCLSNWIRAKIGLEAVELGRRPAKKSTK
jgi:hypothetical protein